MNNDLNGLVRNLMGEIFDCDPSILGPGSSMESIEAWDSMRHLHLVLGLEETLAVQFTGDEIVNMTSYDQIIIAARRALSDDPQVTPGDGEIESSGS